MLFHSWLNVLVCVCLAEWLRLSPLLWPLSVSSISNFTVSVRCHSINAFILMDSSIQISIHAIYTQSTQHTLHDPFITITIHPLSQAFKFMPVFIGNSTREIERNNHCAHTSNWIVWTTFHWMMIWHIEGMCIGTLWRTHCKSTIVHTADAVDI